MSALLHNMSAPPKSSVVFKQRQIQKYISFNPLRLIRLFGGGPNHDTEWLVNKSKEYVSKHPDIEHTLKKPTGYMIAEYIELDDETKYSKELNEKLMKFDCQECNDIELLLLVFGSTVGDLYIPNRTLSFETNRLNKILFFQEEEVKS